MHRLSMSFGGGWPPPASPRSWSTRHPLKITTDMKPHSSYNTFRYVHIRLPAPSDTSYSSYSTLRYVPIVLQHPQIRPIRLTAPSDTFHSFYSTLRYVPFVLQHPQIHPIRQHTDTSSFVIQHTQIRTLRHVQIRHTSPPDTSKFVIRHPQTRPNSSYSTPRHVQFVFQRPQIRPWECSKTAKHIQFAPCFIRHRAPRFQNRKLHNCQKYSKRSILIEICGYTGSGNVKLKTLKTAINIPHTRFW